MSPPATVRSCWRRVIERPVGEKRDEPVCRDALAQFMKDGPQAEVALEPAVAERLLDHTPRPVAAPDQLRIVGAPVGAQPIAAFSTAHGAQFVTVQPIREGAVRRDLDPHQTRRAAAGFFLHGAELGEPRVAGRARPRANPEALPVSFAAAAVHPAG